MSFFNDLALLPEDAILNLPIIFAADPRPNKINLGIGTYKTAEGQPLVLTCVKKAENMIAQMQLGKEYLPIGGDAEFLRCGLELLFGAKPDRPYFAAQTIGGTGALRIAGEFLARGVSKNIFLSQPTWPNHKLIFERSGFNIGSYPYFDFANFKLDFAGMKAAIANMAPASVIVLHSSCHNPTGLDPTSAQWQELSTLIKAHQLFPLFDIAYQGFGTGMKEDAEAIRTFAKDGHEMAVAYSFSKNMGLYGERIGFLVVLTHDEQGAARVASQIKTVIRSQYSTPPLHAARLVTTILKSPLLTGEWQAELVNMRERINEMRHALIAALLVKGHAHHVTSMYAQKGIFSILGLTPGQVQALREENAIFMPSNGRINIAGINMQNLNAVAEALSYTLDHPRQ